MPYTTITDVLNLWSQVGIFAYLLPFLMLFAIVFGILSKINIFGPNKGVNATIALAVGLLSLQSDYVSNFFSNIFPYTGVGIAVLLIALILLGLGTEGEGNSWWLIIGNIDFLAIIVTSFSDIYWWGGKGYEIMQNWPLFLALLISGFVFWLVIKSPEKKVKHERE